MKTFSVYININQQINKPNKIEQLEFVENSFYFKAFFFQYLWCFFNKLWLAGLILLTVMSLNSFAVASGFISPVISVGIAFIINLYMGFIAPQLKEFSLMRKGYSFKENIIANNYIEAQLRFYNNLEIKREMSSPTFTANC